MSKKATPNDTMDVKRMKLDDGTEVITLCISQSDEAPSQDVILFEVHIIWMLNWIYFLGNKSRF